MLRSEELFTNVASTKPISRNSITPRCSLMQRWDDWGNVGSSPCYIVWSLLKLQMPYPNYFLQETVSNLHGYSFLLNILDVPYWRYSVLKFDSTTQQVACDFREANEELQLHSPIPVKDIGSISKQISHHNNSGKGVPPYFCFCQNEIIGYATSRFEHEIQIKYLNNLCINKWGSNLTDIQV